MAFFLLLAQDSSVGYFGRSYTSLKPICLGVGRDEHSGTYYTRRDTPVKIQVGLAVLFIIK